MLPARSILRDFHGETADCVTLAYDERFLRRKRLTCDSGAGFLVDLPETVSVQAGDAFVLDDGRKVAVAAAVEPVVVVKGSLARLAWHIGNRHTPCQVAGDHLIIRRDHVLEAMLAQLGAEVSLAMLPFHPEGGAYGHGRTMGHDHGGHDHG
jgi:urease accessory protein